MLDVYEGMCIHERSRDDRGSNTPEMASTIKRATVTAAVIDPRVNLIDRNILTDVRAMERTSAADKTATIILPASVDIAESQYCIIAHSPSLWLYMRIHIAELTAVISTPAVKSSLRKKGLI